MNSRIRSRSGTHRTLLALALFTMLAAMPACFMNRKGIDDVDKPVTHLRVDNRAFLDMNIFVYRSSQRIRLGFANGGATTKLVVPSNLLFGPTPLRFQADPVGGNRSPITEEITVAAGDEVTLIIPP